MVLEEKCQRSLGVNVLNLGQIHLCTKFCAGESEDDAVDPESQSDTAKRRRTLPKASTALQDALILNREKLVENLDRTQDREDARHKELVNLKRERIDMEREKIEVNREISQALVGALQSMANAMALLGQSLAQGPPRQ